MSTAPGTPAAGADQAAAPEPSPWNIANALTVLRILMVPVFVWLLLRDPGSPDRLLRVDAQGFRRAVLTVDIGPPLR